VFRPSHKVVIQLPDLKKWANEFKKMYAVTQSECLISQNLIEICSLRALSLVLYAYGQSTLT
jgi:hypothetical protein